MSRCTLFDAYGLKDVIVNKVENFDHQIHVWLEPRLQMQVCPVCRHETKRTHSYRMQLVKDLPIQGMHCILHLRKRRYFSSHCKAVFQEKLSLPKLPKVLSVDEFKGNAGGRKYQCILTDPDKRKILDILPSKKSEDLIAYFLQFPLEKRKQVQYLVMELIRCRLQLPAIQVSSNKLSHQ